MLAETPEAVLRRLSHFDLQELRSLHLASFRHYVVPFTFQIASNLANLTLSRVLLPNRNRISWSRLTRYSEIECTWVPENRLAVYGQLPNLVILRLSFHRWSIIDGEVGSVSFANLRVASFRFHESDNFSDFIQTLDMPLLESFSIEGHMAPFPLGVPHTSPHLKILRVRLYNILAIARRRGTHPGDVPQPHRAHARCILSHLDRHRVPAHPVWRPAALEPQARNPPAVEKNVRSI
ncbi:hypothetical protein B0H19DRAFT_1171789 [Mycena capillaripes]|nr:hypothetical protein B0H19DRAFT_1171789 [Mycena capillaripes]